MRVLGVLAAWGVLAVLATMCFALGGSIGYRRGVRDTMAQIRDRRAGKSGCRPLPANHMRRRSSGAYRPGARARRSRWRVPVATARHRRRPRVLSDPRIATLGATLAALVLLGVPATAVGATTAQPGESLYGVKRGLEQVRLAFAFGAERDAKVHIDLAATRLGELAGLVGNDAPPTVIADVSDDLEEHAAAASTQLGNAPDSSDRSQLQRRLRAVANQQVEVMDLALTECAEPGSTCRTLEQTRDETVALRDATTTRAPAVTAGEVPAPPGTPAQADAQASAAPSEPTIAAVDGGDPAATAEDEPGSDDPDAADPTAGGGEDAAGSAADPPPEPAASASPEPDASASPSPSPSPSPSASSGANGASGGRAPSSGESVAPATAPEPGPTSSSSPSPRKGSSAPRSEQSAGAAPDNRSDNEPATDDTGSAQERNPADGRSSE